MSMKTASGPPGQKQFRFVGTSARSRMGCLACKKKKKKCDELLPSCGLCQRLNLECVRPKNISNANKKDKSSGVVGASTMKLTMFQVNNSISKQSVKKKSSVINANKSIVNNTNILNNQIIITTPDNTNSQQADFVKPLSSSFAELSKDFQLASKSPKITELDNNETENYKQQEENTGEDIHDDINSTPPPLDDDFGSYRMVDRTNSPSPLAYDKDFENFLNSQYFGFSPSPPREMINNYHSTILSHVQPLCYLPNVQGKEKQYLEYFIHSVATNISTVPNESNYWFNFYLPLAIHDRSVLNGLISWGGVFLNNSDSQHYRNLSKNSLIKNLNKMSTMQSSRSQLIQYLACSILLQAVEISSGDVKNWVSFTEIATKLIKKLGGIHTLVNSKEEKYLASNFIFHDVLSSKALLKGPLFPISDYEKIYSSKEVRFIDTLQGCVGPLFLILPDILSNSRNLKLQLYANYEESKSSILLINSSLSDYEKIELFTKIQTQYSHFTEKILSSYPDVKEIEYFKSINEWQYHEKVYQLYQKILLIVTSQAFLNTRSDSPSIQLLILESYQLLHYLVPSPVKGVLCLAFVVIGLNCVDENSKNQYLRTIQWWMDQGYIIGNVNRMVEMVKEAWKDDQDNLNCDFIRKLGKVVKKLDWILSLV